jgi:hypothetical protein
MIPGERRTVRDVKHGPTANCTETPWASSDILPPVKFAVCWLYQNTNVQQTDDSAAQQATHTPRPLVQPLSHQAFGAKQQRPQGRPQQAFLWLHGSGESVPMTGLPPAAESHASPAAARLSMH